MARSARVLASDRRRPATASRTGIISASITDIREAPESTFVCEIRVPVAGLRERSERVASVKTGWHLRHAGDRPRLVTAYISG